MVYSYLMHGKFKPSSFWRANYFPYLLMLPPLYSGNFFHFDSQRFHGHIEGRRGYIIPAKRQVNGQGLGADVLRWGDSFILWMHLWTHIPAQSAAGWTYLLYVWSIFWHYLNREFLDLKGVWWEKETSSDYMNKSFSGAAILHSQWDSLRQQWLLF